MKYWFIIDDNPVGPLSIEEARKLSLRPDTPVWYDGLADWTVVGELDESEELLSPLSPPPPVPEEAVETPTPMPRQSFGPGPMGGPMPSPMGRAPYGYTPMPQQVGNVAKCPSTFLVWNIVSCLLCCLPIGIAGIIFSAQVSSAYARGDYERAVKQSSRAEWCVILGITFGVMLAPLQFIIMLQ